MAKNIATDQYSYECFFYKNGQINEFNRRIGGSSDVHVARCRFNTSDINNGRGGTSLSVSIDARDFTENLDSGELYAVLTTDPDSYKGKCAESITDSLVKVSLYREEVSSDEYRLRGTLNYNFLPNTTYYVFFVPRTLEIGVAEVLGEFSLVMSSSPSCMYVTLNKSAGISEVSGEGLHEIGSVVTVSAVLEEGYMFSGWSGSYSSKSKSFTFTMPSKDVNLTASAIITECDLQVYPVVDGEDKLSGYSSAVRFSIYINDVLVKSDVSGYFGFHPYGTKYRITRTFLSEDYRSAKSSISGVLTSDTQLGYEIFKLLPPEFLSISPTKFSNKVTLKWGDPIVSSELTLTGYVIQRSTSEDRESWSNWTSVSDIRDPSILLLKDAVTSKYVKYRIRTSAKLGSTIYYSTKWTLCSPEFAERGSSSYIFDGENLVRVTAYIHDDYGDSKSDPNKVHTLRVFNGTEWVYAGIGRVFATVEDNILRVTGSCTATIEDSVLSVSGSFSGTIEDNILTVK